MGCSSSSIANFETENRCKQRKALMTQSVSARTDFASAHSTYAAALKSTGTALGDYARELLCTDHLPLPPQHPPIDLLRSPTHPNSLPLVHNAKLEFRARSSTTIKSKPKVEIDKLPPPSSPPPPPRDNDGFVSWDFFLELMQGVPGPNLAKVGDKSSSIKSVDIRTKVLDDQNENGGYGAVTEEIEEKTQSKPTTMRTCVKEDVQNLNWLQVFKDIDTCFVKASDGGHEVSKILEANGLHYQSNSAYNPGHVEHSTRVMRVITWNRSFKGSSIANFVMDDFASKEEETHSIVLDKMLAWEKKLYDEIKAGEEMKYEYQRKIASLNKLTKRGASSNSLERTKATVSRLHMKCIVHMQLIDSTVSEINRLRDEQLYPILVQLVEEMGVMWENMQKQHDNQSKIVLALRSIKISQLKETSEHNLNNTQQLHVQVQVWCSEFAKLMLCQTEYIKSLNNWLKLNLISINNNLRDKVSSPQTPQNLKIQSLLRTWQDQLEKLPDERAKTAINTFAAVINTIIHHQSDEMKMKERCEEIRRELTRRSRKFDEWCDKHIVKRTPSDLMVIDVEDDMEVIAEHQMVVEALRRRLEEDEEAYRRQCVQVKDKSVLDLNSGLQEVFAAMSEFSGACSRMYRSLKTR